MKYFLSASDKSLDTRENNDSHSFSSYRQIFEKYPVRNRVISKRPKKHTQKLF